MCGNLNTNITFQLIKIYEKERKLICCVCNEYEEAKPLLTTVHSTDELGIT